MSTNATFARRTSFREEMLWLFPVAILAAALFAFAQALGQAFKLSPWSMLAPNAWKALRALPLVLLAALVLQLGLAVHEGADSPIRATLDRIRALFANRWLVAARLAPLLLMPFVLVGFSSLKMLMPRFVPFWLDDRFAALDRLLFLGHQPWELTHVLLGSLWATRTVDFLYTFWVLLLSIAIVGMALFAPRMARARFFLAFTLAWVLLGVGGAWLGSSAGPCFAALIGTASAPEFAGLMERLAAMPGASSGELNAVYWQHVLWSAHASETYSFGMGISAMPSLHIAIVVLYALVAFRMSRLLGWFMTLYAVVIFIGSVHLAWHYAVDGILAGFAMLLIWAAADRWCRVSGYDAAVAASGRP